MPLSGDSALGNGASSVTLGMSKTVRLSSSKTLGFREPLPFIISFKTSCSFSTVTFTIDVAGGSSFGADGFGNAGSSFSAVFGFSSGFVISTVLVSLKVSSIFSAAILVSSAFGVSAAFSVVFAFKFFFQINYVECQQGSLICRHDTGRRREEYLKLG